MDSAQLAQTFKALGDPTRVRILDCLRCCPECDTFDDDGNIRQTTGATVGEICCTLFGDAEVGSRVSFHLKELRQAGLVQMERKGKFMVCSVRTETLQNLANYLSQPKTECAPACCP